MIQIKKKFKSQFGVGDKSVARRIKERGKSAQAAYHRQKDESPGTAVTTRAHHNTSSARAE